MKKYITKAGFHNPKTGRIKAGKILDDCPKTRELFEAGYLKEYKTKVLHDIPDHNKSKKTLEKKAYKKTEKK